LGFWSQLERRATARALQAKLPFDKVAWQSLVDRKWLYALGSGTLAFVWVATAGVPACSDSIILLLLGAPPAVGLLHAKAEPVALQAISLFTFVVAGLVTALSAGAMHQTSFLWFAIAAVEGIFSANGILAAAGGIFAAMTALTVALFSRADPLPALDAQGNAPIVIPAFVLALVAATGFARFRILHRNLRDVLAETDNRIAESAGCLALRFSISGQASSVSSNCESLFGLAPRELMDGGFFERVQVADRPAFLKAISDASAKPLTATATLRWRGCERVVRENYTEPVFHWLEMQACLSADPAWQGRRVGNIVAFFREVTEAKRADAELEHARAGVLEASITREHFFANVGHEIRAPLNAIAGFAELLASSSEPLPGPEKQREYTMVIQQSVQHLLAIVDSITDMSLIQSGKLPITLVRFAAAPQIDLCCDMLALQARKSGVLLLRAYPANLDTILCDKRLFTQILVNLLSNSIKFTPANGRVTIAARAEATSLLLNVTDNGIGIDAEDLGRLGDPFFQAKGSSGRQDKGTGLGLSIVRGFVGMLGGEIMVASEPEKGTCVRVRLPLESQALTGAANGPVKIATLARLPPPDEPFANQQIMVKKSA
jgi:two-component system, cell cycle sensor histidine kinase DivJ